MSTYHQKDLFKQYLILPNYFLIHLRFTFTVAYLACCKYFDKSLAYLDRGEEKQMCLCPLPFPVSSILHACFETRPESNEKT